MELAHDLAATFGKSGDHRAFIPHLRGIAVGVFNLQRILQRLEPMPLCLAAGIQTQRRDRHHIGAMQCHQGMRRTHEIDRSPAIGQLISHHLRNRQLAQRFIQRLLQTCRQRNTRRHRIKEQRFGLAIRHALELRHNRCIQPHRGKPLQQSRGRFASSIQADTDRHQLVQHRLVGSTLRNLGNVRRQSARRSVWRHDAGIVSQTLCFERVGQYLGKGFPQFFQRLRRQFFDEQFDQKIFRTHMRKALFNPSLRRRPGSRSLNSGFRPAPE